MSESIYATPAADLEVPDVEEHDYYVVSPTKFYLLSVLTLNFYFVYWFYRNWRLIKGRELSGIWPVPRGLFYIFFTHSLFVDINEAIKTKQLQYDWAHSGIATLFVVMALSSSVLERMSNRDLGSPYTDMVALVLALLTPVLLLKAQRAINFVCSDPDGITNSRYTLANWVWMIMGGLLWLLVMIGLYLMVFMPELVAE